MNNNFALKPLGLILALITIPSIAFKPPTNKHSNQTTESSYKPAQEKTKYLTPVIEIDETPSGSPDPGIMQTTFAPIEPAQVAQPSQAAQATHLDNPYVMPLSPKNTEGILAIALPEVKPNLTSEVSSPSLKPASHFVEEGYSRSAQDNIVVPAAKGSLVRKSQQEKNRNNSDGAGNGQIIVSVVGKPSGISASGVPTPVLVCESMPTLASQQGKAGKLALDQVNKEMEFRKELNQLKKDYVELLQKPESLINQAKTMGKPVKILTRELFALNFNRFMKRKFRVNTKELNEAEVWNEVEKDAQGSAGCCVLQ